MRQLYETVALVILSNITKDPKSFEYEASGLVTGLTRSVSLENCTKSVDGQLFHKNTT